MLSGLSSLWRPAALRLSTASFVRSTLSSSTLRYYADERKKYDRNLPHVNVGTIGHVDHGEFFSFRF
jgi:hypothetical protein